MNDEIPEARMYIAPTWAGSAAWIAFLLAAAGFAASCWINGSQRLKFDWEAGLVCGALNPVFFVCLPLAIYWASLVGKSGLCELCPYCHDRSVRIHSKSGKQHRCSRCNKVFIQS